MKKMIFNTLVLIGLTLLLSSTKCEPMKAPPGYHISVQNNSLYDIEYINYGAYILGHGEVAWGLIEIFTHFHNDCRITFTYDNQHHFEFMTPSKEVVADTVLYLPREDVKDKSIRVTFILDEHCNLSVVKTPIPIE